ncbi:MAG: CHASE2 domain-containing protein [Anaerolineae bacterium]|nr:CHASE2 domain-containing protein [Phycisphaerae bacterium]
MIDPRTEAALGEFPFDRAILAKAVDQAAAMKARAVVLNFYLDKPKSEAGDRALAASMRKIPVVLPACIPGEAEKAGEPNPLPIRFQIMRFAKGQAKAIGGKNAWIPIPDFAEPAADIGFSDGTGSIEKIPIVEAYRGAYVKSLWTICMELAFNDGALITPGREMSINDKSLELDEQSIVTIEFPKADRVETISFIDFVNGKTPDAAIKDKVLIIGADTAKMPTVDTPIGKLGMHRTMNLQLLALHAHFTQ